MANIQKRQNADGSVKYRVQVRLKGKPTQTATFERLIDARQWAQATEADIRRGRHFDVGEARKRTLAEAIQKYIDEVLPRKSKSNKQRSLPPSLHGGVIGLATICLWR